MPGKSSRHSSRRDKTEPWYYSQGSPTSGGYKPQPSSAVRNNSSGKGMSYDDYNKSMVTRSREKIWQDVKNNHTKGAGYVQKNPTASGGRKGGQMDREWQNHKWISRERNDAGKWIYDYGGGTSTGARPKAFPKGVNPRKRGAGKINKNSDVGARGVDSDNFPKKSEEKKYNNLFEETTDKAGRALSDAGNAARKTFDDVSSNVGKAISDAGENINKTISRLELDAKVTVTAGKMFLDTLFK